MQNIHSIFNSSFYSRLIEDLQDEALAWRVSFELGGYRYYVPTKVKRNHVFMEYGEDFFEWLVENYGGTALVFPSGMNNIYKRNQIQAELLVRKGYSHNEIAKQLHINYSSARRAKQRVVNKVQASLFDNEE